MNYDFDKMERNKKLYKKMWDKTEFCSDNFITNKNWTGDKVDSSFYIKTPKAAKLFKQLIPVLAEELAEKFEIKNNELFCEKFNEACSGSGQEALKITTMHSSSLCALLFFYNIASSNKKLELKLGNDSPEETYVFDKSFFEFQNVVIEGRQPSNMDVVLVGYEKKNTSQKVVLFLESKFSEYYSTLKDTMEIPLAYLENKYGDKIYNDKLKVAQYDIQTNGGSKSKFNLIAPNKTYIDGVKQMISHYIGVRNLLNGVKVEERACKAHKEVVDAIDNHAKVFLGTIIFDDLFTPPKGKQIDEKEKYYDTYEKSYKSLAEVLNKVPNTTQNDNGVERTVDLTVLVEPFTYTKLLNEMTTQQYDLDEKVKEYYFVNSNVITSNTSKC